MDKFPATNRSCQSCGLTEGQGYGGTPLCQQAWSGSLPRPIPSGCLLYGTQSEIECKAKPHSYGGGASCEQKWECEECGDVTDATRCPKGREHKDK